MMLSGETRIWLLAILAILPIGALLHLRLRRGRRLIAIGLVLLVLAAPAVARLIHVVWDSPPALPDLVPVALHAAESTTIVEAPPAFLLRLIEFELGRSVAPTSCAGRIVLAGERFRIDSPDTAGSVWSIRGVLGSTERGGRGWADLDWTRDAGGEVTVRHSRAFLTPGVIHAGGASLALLGLDVVARTPRLGLLDDGPLGRHLALLVAEPLAEGDQVVEIPFAGWWEDDQEAVYRLLAQSRPAEGGRTTRRRSQTRPAVIEVLSHCSPIGLAVMVAGLVLLGTLLRFRLGTLALGGVVIVMLAATCDRLELSHAEAALHAADARQRALGALQAGSIRFFRPRAARLLEQRWLEEDSVEVRAAIAAAAVSQASITDPPPRARQLVSRIKRRSSSMNAAAEAMTTLVTISNRIR